MSIGYLRCPVDVLYCDLTWVCRPISDVLSNGTGKKNRLLQKTYLHTEICKMEEAYGLILSSGGFSYLAYSTNVIPQPVRIQVSYITAINSDHTCI